MSEEMYFIPLKSDKKRSDRSRSVFRDSKVVELKFARSAVLDVW